MCISWTIKCLILLMHGVTMKFNVNSSLINSPSVRVCGVHFRPFFEIIFLKYVRGFRISVVIKAGQCVCTVQKRTDLKRQRFLQCFV